MQRLPLSLRTPSKFQQLTFLTVFTGRLTINYTYSFERSLVNKSMPCITWVFFNTALTKHTA